MRALALPQRLMAADFGYRMRHRLDGDVVLATVASGSLGAGLALALAGAAGSQPALALLGAGAAATALLLLLAAGWVDALVIVALVLSLPAPYASDALRVAPAAAASAVAVCAWLLRSTVARRALDTGRLPIAAAGALLLGVLLAAAFAQARGTAIREVINWLLLLALLLAATDELAGRPDRRHRLALAIALVMAATGLAALLQFAGVLPSRFRWGQGVVRATAGFGWPNELGMFLALGVPFAVYALAASRTRFGGLLALAGLAATIGGLAATFSRGSWVAALLGTLPLLFVGQARLVLRIWLAALLALVLADLATGGVILTRVASTGTDWVVGQRIALTLSGLQMVRDHPLLGIGPGGFGLSLEGFAGRVAMLWDLTGSAQNAYVQFAAEMGVIGLGAYLWFLGAAVTRLHHAARAAGDAERAQELNDGLLPLKDERPMRLDDQRLLRPDDERLLRLALLWCGSILCFLGFFEWPFAHGVAELIILVLALGCARW